MDVDLPDGLRAELVAAAAGEGVSVDEAVTLAVAEWVRACEERRVLVRGLIAEVMDEDARLLRRLGDA